ncbi:MAG: anthrone oxygenase family protein [Thermomicrobiales bacterium]
MSGIPYVAVLAAAIGCGLNAGIFFTFSTFVMAALKRLPPARGIAAMQSINVLAVTFMFMSVFFGTQALICAGLGVWAIFSAGDQPTALLVSGAGAYLVGTIVVTIVGNVPMNNRLAELNGDDPASAAY